MIKVLIADSYYLSRSGLFSILTKQPDFMVVCQTLDSQKLIQDVKTYQPDVVVMDIRMQSDWDNQSVQELCSKYQTKFLILADDPTDTKIVHLLRSGAQGCIEKADGEECIIQAIRDIHQDKSPISPNVAYYLLSYLRNTKSEEVTDNGCSSVLSHREVSVLRLLSEGLPNKMIGLQLDISERTVEAHVRNILKKLNASSRTHAAFLATKNGWLQVKN